ncbi:MAG: iron-sulfur protein [Ruminococcaceae bacterium]|nr:iron-sulfur protein [Oscillospiraceae bacterium]
MKILVLNGSPKGKYSITLQTVKYLEKLYPSHTFSVFDVGQKIKAIEKDFSQAKEDLEKAEMLLFCYPVYTFIAPYQLHRVIELVKENGVNLHGKYATQITTSKHFYDVTAHKYIEENCADLGLSYIRGLSADMDDLLKDQGQADARAFFDHLIFSVENGIVEKADSKQLSAVCESTSVFVPEATGSKTDREVVVVTNCENNDKKLLSMIDRFSAVCRENVRVVNILDFPFSGGCLGCFNCATDGKCVYKDGFDSFLRNDIQIASAIVYAFRIKDHSMGASFKLYDDRQFCNGHRTVTMGSPVGYIVCGNYENEQNLKMIVEGRAQVGGNYLCGVATDEVDPNSAIDRLCTNLTYALDNKLTAPQNFYGVGGMKIFRDLIWTMQGMMKADHKFYKKHKQYDFPQKNRGTMLKMYLVGALISSPKIRAKMGNKMNEGMLAPYKKLLDSIK